MTTETQRTLSGSLQHGLAILGLFERPGQVIEVSAMARALGIHKSTASRVSGVLLTEGFLDTAGRSGRYVLGPKIRRLGMIIEPLVSVDDLARRHLERLVEATGESAHLGVLDGDEAVTTSVVDGWFSVRMHSVVGRRRAVYASGVGKTLLADLEPDDLESTLKLSPIAAFTPRTIRDRVTLADELARVRQQGFARDDQELEMGLCCIAAPVFDASGSVVAGVGVSGPAERVGGHRTEAVVEHVRWCATQITAMLDGVRGTRWAAVPPSPPLPLAWVEDERVARRALPADLVAQR